MKPKRSMIAKVLVNGRNAGLVDLIETMAEMKSTLGNTER